MKLLTSDWVAPPGADGVRLRIRGLTGLEMLEWHQMLERANGADWASKPAERIQIPPDGARLVLRAVLEWEGIEDELSDESVQALPLSILNFTINEILARSSLTEDQAKNSSSQSRSRPGERTSTARPADGAGTATRATPRRSRSGRSTASAT